MIEAHAQPLAKLAEHLRDDEIHVWQLPYQPRLGRAPLRAILGAYLGLDGEQVMLAEGEHGRPALADAHDRPLGFNWSHSGGDALVAVARALAPGVDLEQLRERPRALAIARRYFTRDEAAALGALPAAARAAAFLQLWTAKEAVLKALGRGIAFGLDRLSIASSEQQLTLQRLDGEDIRAWQLQRLPLDGRLVGALAWRGNARRIRLGTLASSA